MSATADLDPVTALKVRIREELVVPHGHDSGLEILRVVMNEDHKDTTFLNVQRLSLGPANNRANKVILLVGATGGGKTTLINAMVNYIFGVDFADPFRFILIDNEDAPKKSQAESQTDLITAYAFNHLPGMPFEYNYILIDTPGFGDTRGIHRDRELMEQMKSFFEKDYGVSQVDCIGLVVPSSEPRLTQTQSYVFDGLSSMFGRDVRNNIFVMATFSDFGPPAVTKALEDANVTYVSMYKFNNSALYASNSSSDPGVGINRHNWVMGMKVMDDFFFQLGETFPVSLQLTKEVLRSRSQLQWCLRTLDTLIHVGLDKLVTLEKEKAMLESIEVDLKDCENYEQEIEVPRVRRVNKSGGNSRNSFRLSLSFDLESVVKACAAVFVQGAKSLLKIFGLGKSGSAQAPDPFKLQIDYGKESNGPQSSLEEYGYEYVTEKRTIKQLMDRYKKTLKNKTDKEQVIRAIENDIKLLGNQLLQLIAQAQAHEQMLKNIALKHDSISVEDYIDLMIQVEKNQRSLRWEKRVEMLTQLKKDAEALGNTSGWEET